MFGPYVKSVREGMLNPDIAIAKRVYLEDDLMHGDKKMYSLGPKLLLLLQCKLSTS